METANKAFPETLSPLDSLGVMQKQADEVIESIAEIKEQIARAKANTAKTGIYADENWFHSASRALRHKQADHQILLREMARVRAEIKKAANLENEARTKTFERDFMKAAKLHLDEATYLLIMRMAGAAS